MSSTESSNCYCGKERNLNAVELMCWSCNKWFHEGCVSYQLGKLVPFMTNYVFACKNCSSTGLETFKKNQAPFPQMCITAIANLQQESAKEGTNKSIFSKDGEIIPFIEQYWEAMTTMPRRVTQSWYATVQRALVKDIHILFTYEENAADGQMFGLVSTDVTNIKPNYEAMFKGGQLKISDISANGALKGRATKRRPESGTGTGSGIGGKKGRSGGNLGSTGDTSSTLKPPSHGYPADHPFNKDGYRYILAEPDPHAPFRREFDESNEWSGKPIPGWLYRALASAGGVLLTLHDRAPQLKLSEDRLAVTGEKGYCMVRASHGVTRGNWYWEATVEEMPEGSAGRIGWGQKYANLQAPLGYDKFGYSWRSRKGTRFHESHGKHYSDAYGEGDTLGLLICLPDTIQVNHIPSTYKDRPLVKFRNHLYYEDKDNVQEALSNLKPLAGSKIIFFKNGESQGEAFVDIYGGCYYPSVSLHKNATLSINFGPTFKYTPKTDIKYKAMFHKAEESICEQTMSDMLYLVENEGKLRLENYTI